MLRVVRFKMDDVTNFNVFNFNFNFNFQVVGLWVHSRAGDWPERKARRDERRLVILRRGLLASSVCFFAADCLLQGVGGTMENLCSGLDRAYGEGSDVSSRWRREDLRLV